MTDFFNVEAETNVCPLNRGILVLVCYGYQLIGLVFASGQGDLGSIPGRAIPKTFKMVLNTSLLNTQQYKARIKDKVEQSRSSALPYISV